MAIASANFDADNRLTQWGSVSPAYDLNGNLTNDGSRIYTWDARDRLTTISGAASFTYDALNRRQSKTIGAASTAFLYDGLNPIQEISGATPTANLLIGPRADQIFTRTTSVGAWHLMTDAVGSTLALTDGSGAIQTQYTYEPFGNTTTSGPANDNSYQYTGRENDGTGLYYCRARYYNPIWQRFISEDPVGLAGGINRYAYVGNDPLNRADPTGTTPDQPQPQNGGNDLAVSVGSPVDQIAAPATPSPGTPVPVVLNNGRVVQNPLTGGPLLQPAGVSLAQNAQIGQVLSLLPSAFSGGDPYREAAMSALFLPGQPMDYQRVYGSNGQINRTFIAFGNYNYGVVAAAAGYTLDQALFGAGLANLLGSGNSSGPYFNNPLNVPFITSGFNAYQAGLIVKPGWRK